MKKLVMVAGTSALVMAGLFGGYSPGALAMHEASAEYRAATVSLPHPDFPVRPMHLTLEPTSSATIRPGYAGPACPGYTREVTMPTPACGFNSLGAAKPGIHICGNRRSASGGCEKFCRLLRCR